VSVDEPALQHKRRVDGPPTSLSVNYDAEGKVRAYDDFALLGKQDKFASNVRYPIYRPPKPSKVSVCAVFSRLAFIVYYYNVCCDNV